MKVLLVDDEELARSRLRRLLSAHDDVEVVGEAENGAAALQRIVENVPDLVFLDVEMPGIDGLGVAESAANVGIVFTTSHSRYGADAFEANAIDFLVKPISRERLARALTKARAHLASRVETSAEAQSPWRLIVSEGTRRRFVDARQVDLFETDHKYVSFRVRGESVLLRDSLDALEARLSPFGFVRAHRGALVRVEAIAEFDSAEGGAVVLVDGTRVPVSRRALSNVRAALGLD